MNLLPLPLLLSRSCCSQVTTALGLGFSPQLLGQGKQKLTRCPTQLVCEQTAFRRGQIDQLLGIMAFARVLDFVGFLTVDVSVEFLLSAVKYVY